jgi:hypothetical protein
VLSVSEDALEPDRYPGIGPLHEAQSQYAALASDAQGRYFAEGLLASVLAPCALLLLSLQLLIFAHGGQWAIGMILSEIVCLGLLTYFALTRSEPTSEWITNRIRAELLRREQYLAIAGVGPYLVVAQKDVVGECLRRKGQIEATDSRALALLIPMQDADGRTWVEAVREVDIEGRADLVHRMESYLYYRLARQELWFANEMRGCERSDDLWSKVLTLAFLGAIVAAAVHVVELRGAVWESLHSEELGLWGIVTGTFAVLLPPVGTAVIALRGMYDFRGRGRVYMNEKYVLTLHRSALEALLHEARQLDCASGTPEVVVIDGAFRSLAARAEQSLSMEMQQWFLIMERCEQEIAP